MIARPTATRTGPPSSPSDHPTDHPTHHEETLVPHTGSGSHPVARPAPTVRPVTPPPPALAVRSVRTDGGLPLVVGPIADHELDALFTLFATVVDRGEGYPHAPPLTPEVFAATWIAPVTLVVAARLDDVLTGAYYLKPNFPGRAAHIANAGYVVDGPRRGAGIGRALVEDSLLRAPLLGFDAIQFNLVFAANPARRLYEQLGWRQIGRLPDAVDGQDAVIYWRPV